MQPAPYHGRTELREALETISGRFEGVTGEDWDHTGTRSEGMQFTVETMGRYLALHLQQAESRTVKVQTA